MDTLQALARERRRQLVDRCGWWMFGATLGACVAGIGAWMAAGAWIGTGFFAKQLCSGVFVSGREPQQIVESDLRLYLPAIVHRHIGWKIDESAGVVRARWLKGVARTARYKDAQGCELVYDESSLARPDAGDAMPVRAGATRLAAARRAHMATDRTVDAAGRAVLGSAQRQALDAVVDDAFTNEGAETTRAVVVVHRGMIVAERYAPGFDASTRFPGWSLSKSVMNAMIGALAAQGRLRVDDPVPVASWRNAGDGRHAVTYDHLLRMSSGLRFDENYASPFSDVSRMLFGVADAGAYAESRALASTPGSVWSYSSGSTMVLAHVLATLADSPAAYREMPRRLVFGPLGMQSAVMETDARGTFEATSSVYATAADWARFGWLYANDGLWNGRRILPMGWVAYSSSPARSDPSGRYAAHFWRYTVEDRDRVEAAGASLPQGAFYAEGFGGQRITISPSGQTVVVRLGAGTERNAFDNTMFAGRVLAALGIRAPVRQAAGDRSRDQG